MRILHTSDLHLGRTLYGVQRHNTFVRLMDWLIETVRRESVDCVILAGDIYDSSTPPNSAQTLYYNFLAELLKRTSCRNTIVVGGNHDSATLLDAGGKLLSALNITVVGNAADNLADEVVLVRNSEGHVQAAVLAVPYLRERNVRVSFEHETEKDKTAHIIEGTRRHYHEVLQAALRKLEDAGLSPDKVPIIATGHLFAASAAVGGEERNLYVGSLGEMPVDIFDERIDYVALGHIHRAQRIAGNSSRRYCGSPIALDFSEHQSDKQVLIVEVNERNVTVHEIAVPAFDRLERVRGSRVEILAGLEHLKSENEPILCEVVLDQGTSEPELAEACRIAVANSQVELVRVINQSVLAAHITEEDGITDVEALTPEQMFELRLAKEKDLDDDLRGKLRQAHEQILAELRDSATLPAPCEGKQPCASAKSASAT